MWETVYDIKPQPKQSQITEGNSVYEIQVWWPCFPALRNANQNGNCIIYKYHIWIEIFTRGNQQYISTDRRKKKNKFEVVSKGIMPSREQRLKLEKMSNFQK